MGQIKASNFLYLQSIHPKKYIYILYVNNKNFLKFFTHFIYVNNKNFCAQFDVKICKKLLESFN